jgi:hypothetical protein
MATERLTLAGRVTWRLETDGRTDAEGETTNQVTQAGDQAVMERGAGATGAPAAPAGMKLGTGSTATAKTGAGAQLATYLANSHQAFEAGYPASSLNGAARRASYRATWAAGKATSGSPITEVVIVNDALVNATSAESATMARALLTGSNAIPGKLSTQALTVTWTHDLSS